MRTIVMIGCLLTVIAVTAKTDSKKDAADGFSDYDLILTRNVFDSTRKPVSKVVKETPPAPEPKPTPKVIMVSGTALGQGKAIAFFKSAITIYDAMMEPGAKLGDLSVKEILMDRVVVTMKDAEFTIPVGAHLTDQGQGKWAVVNPDPVAVAKKRAMDDALDDLIDDL